MMGMWFKESIPLSEFPRCLNLIVSVTQAELCHLHLMNSSVAA